MICREEMEQGRKARDRGLVEVWDLVKQGQKNCQRLKKILDSSAGWEEVWGLADQEKVVEWARVVTVHKNVCLRAKSLVSKHK